MQMVATSKMRRAQDRMRLARPYAQKMRNVIGHLTEANPDYRHPFLQGAGAEGDRHHRDFDRSRTRRRTQRQRVQARDLFLMREWQQKGAEVNLLPHRQQRARVLQAAWHTYSRKRVGAR